MQLGRHRPHGAFAAPAARRDDLRPPARRAPERAHHQPVDEGPRRGLRGWKVAERHAVLGRRQLWLLHRDPLRLDAASVGGRALDARVGSQALHHSLGPARPGLAREARGPTRSQARSRRLRGARCALPPRRRSVETPRLDLPCDPSGRCAPGRSGDRFLPELGRDRSTPRLLSISLSANDYVGHVFGVDSWEAWDQLRRLDAELARLFAELDAAEGPEGWALVLSADHGVPPTPEALAKGCDERRRASLGAACGAAHRHLDRDLAAKAEQARRSPPRPGRLGPRLPRALPRLHRSCARARAAGVRRARLDRRARARA
jgi:hypothetical protein